MQGFTDFLKTIGAGRIIAMGIVAVMLLSFFGFISMRLSQPQLGILYADLDMGQTAEITARLDAMQIPHRLTDNGHTVMVPRDRLMDLRIQLAGEGIGGGIGYELLDNQDRLGTTSFLQNINHRRAVEGELARTISRLNMVRDARIHLVLPERQLFAREQDQPSASITLTTRGTLGSQQVAAIRQLVAASVPALSPDRISIVDQNGSLLARSDGEGDDQTATALEERREKMERSLENSVERLLERTLGPGRVRAEVSVELDREAVTEDSQIYDPDRQVVVSSETQSTNERSTEGTPEAVSVAG
ncbi:MAG: flagellar basal-body MS-ring/collar protein FliF, partial [Pseudomonadota bacterium]